MRRSCVLRAAVAGAMLLGTSCGEDTARVETLASSGDPADKSATPELDRIADTLVDLAANDREYVVLVAKVTDYVLDEAPTLIPEGIDPEKGAEIAAKMPVWTNYLASAEVVRSVDAPVGPGERISVLFPGPNPQGAEPYVVVDDTDGPYTKSRERPRPELGVAVLLVIDKVDKLAEVSDPSQAAVVRRVLALDGDDVVDSTGARQNADAIVEAAGNLPRS